MLLNTVGLSGSINRSGGDIKREEKEEDENRSIADKSDDETRDANSHLRTRCLKHLNCIVAVMLLFCFRQNILVVFMLPYGSENMEPISPAASV